MATGILAMGGYVPPQVVENSTIANWADTTPEWVLNRTGIHERRYAPPGTPTSALAYSAVENLLQSRPDALDHVGAIILATSTPDQPQPASAALLQRDLPIGPVMTFDLNAVCAGFLTGLQVGTALAAHIHSHVLLVGADRYSAIMDRADRRTVALFGDGAGAVLLGDIPPGFGLEAARILTHGEHADYVEVVAGGTKHPLTAAGLAGGADRFRMKGHPVRNYALAQLPALVESVLADAGIKAWDVDRWFFHQANVRMLEECADAIGIDIARVPMTAPFYGNTANASIPLTLCHANAERPFTRGERLALIAIGGGMTIGAALYTWH